LRRASKREDQKVLIEIVDSAGAVTARILDSIWGLLDSSLSARRAVLRENPHWFDRSEQVFQKEARKIARLKDPVERLRRCNSWRSRSCEAYYRQLYDSVSRRKGFDSSELLPN